MEVICCIQGVSRADSCWRVRGEDPLAFVVLKPGTSVKPEELIEFCRGKIATYKLPREVVIVNEISVALAVTGTVPMRWPERSSR